MKLTLILFGLFVSGVLLFSMRAFAHDRTGWRLLQLGGAMCLGLVIFAHVAEEFHLLPGMGWGLPHSSGHYVDLASATIGVTLFPLGLCASAVLRHKERKSGTN